MTAELWLSNRLSHQELADAEVNALRRLRDQIEGQLNVLQGNPRFYYAGSYGKKTMIRERYDLDIVVYWPSTSTYTIKGIYDGVGDQLKKHWNVVRSKTVSWELPFDGGFHIDVVPGRALDSQCREANLYRTDTGTTLKTSLKTHIDTVRNSGRRDAIRLAKIWRERCKVPFKKSFLLELMTIEACKGKAVNNLNDQLQGTLEFIRDNIETCSVSDPANSNNSLSDDLDGATRRTIKSLAATAASATNWKIVFNYS